MKKIKINDKRNKKLIIISIVSVIIIIAIIIIGEISIKRSISKDIVTVENVEKEEIEWLEDDNEELDIDNIIANNLNDQVKEVIETQVVELEYETQYQESDNLAKGKTRVIQKGKDGEQELIIKKKYSGKKLISDKQIGRKVIKAPINKIIEIGTGKASNNKIKIGNTIIDKNIALNRPSGLTLEQFEKMLCDDSNDKNGVFSENAKYFYYIEQSYGINGVFVAAVGIHESNWGTSKISTNKKNLFGYGAYDMNSYSSAYSYDGYAASIDMIARVFIKHYLYPKGTNIYDGEVATGKYYYGNTLSDVNKKYASDKNWANCVYTWMKYLYNKL